MRCLGREGRSVLLVPFSQSSNFGIPLAFFRGLQTSTVYVRFVRVGAGEWSSLDMTDMGLPRAEMSNDCLLSRMCEQSRLMV